MLWRRSSARLPKLRQNRPFPADAIFNLAYVPYQGTDKKLDFTVSELFEHFPDKDEIIILYQFPRPQVAFRDPDPLMQYHHLKEKLGANSETKLVVGISHQMPGYLRQL